MNNMPKISVIIPVFNAQKYLLESIGSVLNQTLKEIEIIVINDGSTDQTLEILESISIKDSRLIILNQKESRKESLNKFASEVSFKLSRVFGTLKSNGHKSEFKHAIFGFKLRLA